MFRFFRSCMYRHNYGQTTLVVKLLSQLKRNKLETHEIKRWKCGKNGDEVGSDVGIKDVAYVGEDDGGIGGESSDGLW